MAPATDPDWANRSPRRRVTEGWPAAACSATSVVIALPSDSDSAETSASRKGVEDFVSRRCAARPARHSRYRFCARHVFVIDQHSW